MKILNLEEYMMKEMGYGIAEGSCQLANGHGSGMGYGVGGGFPSIGRNAGYERGFNGLFYQRRFVNIGNLGMGDGRGCGRGDGIGME
jgi:hypothetical protein